MHGDISVQDPLILSLVDAPEFQRLRRIRQLGTSYISYPGADHTRFAHSLGVYHLLRRVLRHFAERGYATPAPDEQRQAACAALLHDIGHGPFSHLFEKITGTDHEHWAQRIITTPGSVIHERLTAAGAGWPQAVADLLARRWQGPGYMPGLLSSQVDVDRMDYLLRDSLMCGVSYGRFDLDRLISCLRVHTAAGQAPAVAVHRKGQSAAEAFLLARYFMYWNVYFHKATRSAEVILEQIFHRATHLYRSGQRRVLGAVPPRVVPMLAGQEPDLADYLQLDEVDCLFTIKHWAAATTDAILSDLCRRFMNRDLLRAIPLTGPLDDDLLERIRARVAAAGYAEPHYYVQVDRTANVAYSYYVQPRGDGPQPVLLVDDATAGQVSEISRSSDVLRSVTTVALEKHLLFVPKETSAEVVNLLARQLSLDF